MSSSEKIRCAGRDQRHPELFQVIVAGELYRQVTGEPVRALYNDRPHAVAGDAVEHGTKPGRSAPLAP